MKEAAALLFSSLVATSAFAESPRTPRSDEQRELVVPQYLTRPMPQLHDSTVNACEYHDDGFERGAMTRESVVDGMGIIISVGRFFVEREIGDQTAREARRLKYEQSLQRCSAEDFLAARVLVRQVFPPSVEGNNPMYDFIARETEQRLMLLRDASDRGV